MINLEFAGDDYDPQKKITITAPKSRWLGRLESGDYCLATPDNFARKHLMPLPAVRRLMSEGDLPYVQFGRQAYVIEKAENPSLSVDIERHPLETHKINDQ